jgi:A/G-specific adenine glycosylase
MPQRPSRRNPPPNRFDVDALLAWYDRSARVLPWRVGPAARRGGERPDPYSVWLSEVMLQQTTVAAVADYFTRFRARWPTVSDLAAAPRDDVMAQWAGLGYYTRARNLHACAQTVVGDYAGQFPRTAASLMALPGIGPYTAAAIAAICFDERVAVLDGNVERVMARFGAVESPMRDAKAELRAEVQGLVPERAGDFAQAMMDLGATLCAPRRTMCGACPLEAGCRARAAGTMLEYPVKPKRTERPVRHGHAYVLARGDGAIWLRRRAAKGLLGAMMEVPTSPWTPARADPEFPIDAVWAQAGHVTHVFTHFRLELDVWIARSLTDPPGEGWWETQEGLAGAALPSVFRKVLAAAAEAPGKRKTAGPRADGV